jgi:hypothetical protein
MRIAEVAFKAAFTVERSEIPIIYLWLRAIALAFAPLTYLWLRAIALAFAPLTYLWLRAVALAFAPCARKTPVHAESGLHHTLPQISG